jgi:hypothetical protein
MASIKGVFAIITRLQRFQNLLWPNFTVYDAEWWHFDYGDWQKYRIGNVTFEQLQNRER